MENCWRRVETERKHSELVKTFRSDKGSFFTFPLIYLILPIAAFEIKGGKVLSSPQTAKRIILARQGVNVFFCDVELSVINRKAKRAILLLDEYGRGGPLLLLLTHFTSGDIAHKYYQGASTPFSWHATTYAEALEDVIECFTSEETDTDEASLAGIDINNERKRLQTLFL